MSLSRQTALIPDDAQAPVVGVVTHWPSRSEKAQHTHSRHQLLYSQKGVIHVSAEAVRKSDVQEPICGGGSEARLGLLAV
jgi:hypothetical protein